jgi:hypothetical protein
MSENQLRSITEISNDVLRELRQQALQARGRIANELFPELPKHVEIASCEVAFTLHPRALPYKNISFEALRSMLEQEYGLHFKLPDLDTLAPLLQGKPASLSGFDIGEMLLKQSDPELTFEDGLMRLPDGKAITIERILLRGELVLAKVVGPTQAAEHLICEIVPLMWALAGVRRTWEEAKVNHQVVRYGTGTKIRLSDGGRPLLSKAFLGLLESWVKPSGLALQMGARTQVNDWMPPAEASVSFTLEDLNILFQRVGMVGGAETCQLRVTVVGRHERGTGNVLVSSELPFPEHLELVSSLANISQGQ